MFSSVNNFGLTVCREEVGPDAARKFLGHTQWLVNYWLLQNGFSIGIEDTIADADTMEKINETITNAKTEVKGLIKHAQDKELEPEPGRTMMESFENRVNQVLLNVLVWFFHLGK
jgi:DNA-directed RNA polymerase II subunit RPB1